MATLSSMLTFVALVLCYSIYSVNCQVKNRALVDRSNNMAANLYASIRSVAFPVSPELEEDEANIDTRFILLTPGKILNYFDYNPGSEYTEFIQNPDKDKKFAVVPPHVMEKWFDLADVIPSANPLNGQDTGRSLSNIYKSMLKDTKIKNLEEQGEQVLALYNQALDFLNEVTPHPENLSMDTTRFALYDEYKELYSDRRLEMEDQIEMKRKNLQYIDYELWFQRHYPALLSTVESAYVRWLIFGQKELCDIYITYLDTGTSAKALEEARIIMRASGVTALDRTRTIYPVSFEPSDWYKYLIPTVGKPSRAELQDLLGKIKTKIAYVNGEIDFYSTKKPKLDEYGRRLESLRDAQSKRRSGAVTDFIERELECTVQNMGVDTGAADSCEAFMMSSNNLTTALRSEADSIANVGDYNWASNNKAVYIESLKSKRTELENQQQLVLAALGKVDPLVGSIVNSNPDVIEAIIDSRKEDKWLQFEFNSEEEESKKTEKSSSKSSRFSVGYSGWFVSGSYSSQSSESKYELSDTMSKASLKAKGKLLRVFIKRPWFKPEVFDDRNLDFVANSDNGAKVLGAPGNALTEVEFVNAITGGDGGPDDVIYRLPEYITSFLLAKDIELEISNANRNFFRSLMKATSKSSWKVSILSFKMGSSSSSSSNEARTRVHKTANGMKIKIPGTQVIGYYTQKLPQFPRA